MHSCSHSRKLVAGLTQSVHHFARRGIRAIREPLDVAGGCVCRPFASGVHSAARVCNVFRRVSESVIGQDNGFHW